MSITMDGKQMPQTDDAAAVAPGYKRTDVGIIPRNWEAKSLGELATFRTGPFGSALHKADYIGGGVPLINPMHIVEGQLVPQSETSVSEQAAHRLSAYRLRPADIVIGRRGDIGRCAVVQQSHAGWLCGTGSLIIRCSDRINAEFLQRVLTTERVIGCIEAASVGSTMVNLNQAALSGLRIPSPPLPEQRAIAEALSDVDGLLGALEALITKKRAIKQAAMQQLLSGKTRLPGFSKGWETKRLGEIGHFLKGSGVTRDSAHSGPLACVRYGEIYTAHHDYIRMFNSWISAEVAASATRLAHGDLLFAGSGETKEEIGKCVAFLDEREAYAGGDIVILRPRTIADSLFLGYALNTSEVNRQKASLGQGDAVVHINATALAQVGLLMPPPAEQTAIATVLSDMDAEIAALERRLDKTLAIKQGMMQQLLTGRVRLVKRREMVQRAQARSKKAKGHNKQFDDAVVIAVLSKQFGTEQFPLGRKRYTKLSYLLKRHAKRPVDDYLRKAAGPYNPKTKYGGAEQIAMENGYVRVHLSDQYSGFVAANKIGQAENYFEKWYGQDSVRWLEQFRFKKNDELEVLATVDMAAEELRASGRNVDVAGVKDVIRSHPEWEAKLDRPIFSDTNIAKAIAASAELFGSNGERGP